MPEDMASKLVALKQEQRLTFADLGKRIGVSGTLLSSRSVHHQGTASPRCVSSPVLNIIDSYLKSAATSIPNRDSSVALKEIETSILVAELKKRGATSIVF